MSATKDQIIECLLTELIDAKETMKLVSRFSSEQMVIDHLDRQVEETEKMIEAVMSEGVNHDTQ